MENLLNIALQDNTRVNTQQLDPVQMFPLSHKYEDEAAHDIFFDYRYSDKFPKNIDKILAQEVFEQSGAPYLKLGEPGDDFRAKFTVGRPFPTTVDTMHIPQTIEGDIDFESVIAELSHGYQFNHPELQGYLSEDKWSEHPLTGEKSYGQPWWRDEPSINMDYVDSLYNAGKFQRIADEEVNEDIDMRYYIPGMVEHQAHQVIEPWLDDIIRKNSMWTREY